MHVRSLLVASLAALAITACAGDRATAPSQDEAAQAAAEFERVAADLGLAAGIYSSGAAALRGGARLSKVQITVAGVAEEWNAFGHEIQLDLPPELTAPDLEPPPPLRALVAWRSSASGFRVVHMLSTEESGALGPLIPPLPGNDQMMVPLLETSPSYLIYSESRDLLWQAASGQQTSRLVATGAACPVPPRRSPSSPPPPSCVHATFSFGFTNVQAQPFTLRFGPAAPPAPSSGTRSLSMSPQDVAGVKIKVTLTAFAVPPIAARAAP